MMTLDEPAKSIDEMFKNVIGASSERYNDQKLDKTKMSFTNSENDEPPKSIDEMLKNVSGASSERYNDQKLDKTKMSITNSENSPTRKSLLKDLKSLLKRSLIQLMHGYKNP